MRTGWRTFPGKVGAANRQESGSQAEFAPAACAAVRAIGLLPSGACVPPEGREGHRLRRLPPKVHHLAKRRWGWSKAVLKQSLEEGRGWEAGDLGDSGHEAKRRHLPF